MREPIRVDYTNNELEIVRVLWQENRELSRSEIIDLSPNKSWKASSIHILLNSLLDKGAISVAGFVRTGKNYGRTYRAVFTQEEYAAMLVTKASTEALGGKQASIVGIFANLIEQNDITQKDIAEIEDFLKKKRKELDK